VPLRRRLIPVAALALASLAAGVSACRDDPESPPSPFRGSYRLVSVGGATVPFPLPAQCPLLGDCKYLQRGRIEVMSRGRIRDILEWAAGPPPWRPFVDTVVSPYEVMGNLVIVKRHPFDNGSPFGVHVDSGELDAQRRLLIVPKVVDRKRNGALYFYAPEE
jgi:hypothetical protein